MSFSCDPIRLFWIRIEVPFGDPVAEGCCRRSPHVTRGLLEFLSPIFGSSIQDLGKAAPSNLEPPSSRALKADPNDAAKHDYFGGTSYTSSIMGPQTYSNC